MEAWIGTLNKKLDRCKVEQRGLAISLRALLPGQIGKTDAGEIKQRRISLHLKVTSEQAKSKTTKLAYKLDEQLGANTFDWGDWSKEALAEPSVSAIDLTYEGLCKGIEARFDATYPPEKKTARTTWGRKYKPAINYFSQFSGAVDMEGLCKALKQVESDSSRKSHGSIVSVTLDHLELEWEKGPLFKASAGYKRSSLQPRDIKSDEVYLAAWEAITDPRWKWVHGMVLAFGIRPNEVKDSKFRRRENVLDVREFKDEKVGTRSPVFREAWALPDEWVERLGLRKEHRPTCDRLDVAAQYGDYMERNHKEHYHGGLYNLRHAYAIRGLIRGVDPSLGAKLMGHSIAVHRESYQHWINKDHMAQLRTKELHKFKSA